MGCVFWMSVLQFRLAMHYLSEMTEEQTLVMYSGHPQGLFPSPQRAPRVVITNGMVRGTGSVTAHCRIHHVTTLCKEYFPPICVPDFPSLCPCVSLRLHSPAHCFIISFINCCHLPNPPALPPGWTGAAYTWEHHHLEVPL